MHAGYQGERAKIQPELRGFAVQYGMALSAASAALAGFLSFTASGHLSPPDKLYVPARLEGKVPLVVALHGCQEDADAFAKVTGLNALAEKEGFLVLYPNEQWGRNPYNCWNWFLPVNQAAGLGEPAEIAAAVLAAEALYPVDPERIYVTGLSAGGAEAATMLSCYPSLFAAGAIHSGVAYGVAQTPGDALEVMKHGPGAAARAAWCDPSAFRGGALVIQGAADPAVNPSNADRLASDFSGADVRETLVPGLGHAWAPDATAEIWDFFKGRRRR
jgi:poly(hydroxyalkanoate) depolymerase family esterase